MKRQRYRLIMGSVQSVNVYLSVAHTKFGIVQVAVGRKTKTSCLVLSVVSFSD